MNSLVLLQKDLEKINKIISIKKILNQHWQTNTIEKYYQKMDFLYRYFHSKEGAMHFPLYLPNGEKHHAEALTEQANCIINHAKNINAKKIIELGCGMGYNVRYIAEKLPKVESYGLDLSENHLKFAAKKSKLLPNTNWIIGNLENPTIENFDILFAVESFCYTQNLELTLQNWYNATKKGGKAVIFDVFLPKTYAHAHEDFKIATQMTAIGFAVKNWWEIELVEKIAKKIGWKINQINDISASIQPNLQRFGKDTTKLLNYYRITKFCHQIGILPSIWLKHCVTGILAAHTIGSLAQAYYQIELEK
ncbi:MAG: class I SAM-dependent methyltransferase [Bacteroidetes bacterium]|nr:MAG: class I SAM-dependent methyltransferase [Bacteroidota bacterium]